MTERVGIITLMAKVRMVDGCVLTVALYSQGSSFRVRVAPPGEAVPHWHYLTHDTPLVTMAEDTSRRD